MTKTELMETYTAEQIADMTEKRKPFTNEELIQEQRKLCKRMSDELYDATEENKRLQSEVEKYRKAFEDANKERDFQIAEYQKKIKEMTDRAILEFPTEPIDVANFLINGLGASWHYDSFGVSELRQIAEHLLIYCNHNKEEEE